MDFLSVLVLGKQNTLLRGDSEDAITALSVFAHSK